MQSNGSNLVFTRGGELPALLNDRILILDGAMGTMLQRNNFSDEDFRGERFKDFPVTVD